MSRILCSFLLMGLLVAPAFGQPSIVEQRKIDFLINSVANLQGAVFIRNGMDYDSMQAADHLRVKLRYAGGQVKTAEDFIVYCATGSSISGERYRIRFADGRIVDSAAFLRERLAGLPGPP